MKAASIKELKEAMKSRTPRELAELCLRLAWFKTVLRNLYERQLSGIEKAVSTLHEDLQYDFQLEIDRLREQDGG